MKKQFQSLTEKGRWLLATLTLIFTLGIGQMWGATVSWTSANQSALPSYIGSGEIVACSGTNTAFNGSGDSKVLRMVANSASVTLSTSSSYKITSITIKVVNRNNSPYGLSCVNTTAWSPSGCWKKDNTVMSMGSTSAMQNGDYTFTPSSPAAGASYSIYVYKAGASSSTRADWSQISVTYESAGTCSETAPAGASVTGGNTYTKGDALTNLTATTTAGTNLTYQWYRNTENTATVSEALKLANCTTATLAPTNKVGTYYYYYTASNCAGTVTSSVGAVTINANCPSSGDYFSFTMNSSAKPGSEQKAPASGSMSIDQYLNIDGGNATIGNVANSQKSSVTTTSDVKLTATTGYLQLDLDCAIAAGDVITIAKNSNKICISDGYKSSGADGTTYTTATSSESVITVGSTSGWIGKKTLYIWYSNGNVNITAVTINRPVMRTITLKYADGATADGELLVEDGTAATKPADPTWAHHRFDGWYNGEDPYVWTANVTGDLTLTAHWTQLYTVTYAKGDESATGDAPTQDDLAAGEKFNVAANTFAVDGKDFDTWNDGTADVAPNTEYTMGSANVILTAKWKAASAKYTVHYMDANGTTPLAADELVEVTQKPAGLAEDPTKPLYTFAAWQLSGVDIALDAASWTSVAANTEVTLTARWTKAYAADIDFEAFIDANGTSGNWQNYLSTNNYAISNTADVSLDNQGTSKPADKGLKMKNHPGAYVSFNVNAGKLVLVKMGRVNGMDASVDGGANYAALNGSGSSEGASVVNYLYNASEAEYRLKTTDNAYNIIQSITITNPYQVSFNTHGADAIAAATFIGTEITLPTPTNGTGSFKGWYDAAEGGTLIGAANAGYTPTADIILHAQWETVSTVNTLSDLQVDGATVEGFDPATNIYYLVYEYGQQPQITSATATAGDLATVTINNEPVDEGTYKYVQVKVVPESGDNDKKFYQVRYTNKPKKGVELIKVMIPNGTGNAQEISEANITGYIGGTANQKLEDGKHKLGSKGHYIGITLAKGTFLENDLVNVNIETVTGDKLRVFSENTAAEAKVVAQSAANMVAGVNTVTLGATTTNSLYLRRGTDDENYQKGWNPFVGYISVERYMAPIIKSYKIGAVSGTIDQEHKTIAIELPYGTSLYGVAATVEAYANGGATVIAPTPLAYDTPLGYKVSSAYAEDGDVDYTVTITEAEHYEAMIVGGANYETLAAAVAAAQADDVVKLLDNVDLMATGLTIAENITLDLNGFNIKAGEQIDNDIVVPAGKKLTLVDNSANAEGKIYTEQAYTGAVTGYGLIRVAGELLMQSGNIYAVIESDPANLGQFAVVLGAGGKATIEGGQIKAGWYAISNNGNNTGSTIIVSGGELISTADFAIYNPAKESTVTVSGGVVYGAAGGIAMNRGELTVTGGTITSKDQGTTGTWGDGTGGLSNAAISASGKYESVEVEISGGTIIAEGTAVMITNGTTNPVEVAISGGQFSHVVPAEYCADGFAPVTTPNAQGKYEVIPVGILHGQAAANSDGVYYYTLDNDVVIYASESDGRLKTSTNTATSSDVVTCGGDAGGHNVNKGSFVLQFPVNVKEFTIYGANSTERTISKVYVNAEASKTIKISTDGRQLTGTYTNTKDEKCQTLTAVFAGENIISANDYVLINLSGSVNMYRILYTEAECTDPVITAVNNAIGTVGESATVSVEATALGATYQWYTCDENGDNAEIIGTATAASYTFTKGAGVEYFKVVVGNNCNTATVSAVAKAEVWAPTTTLVDVTENTTWDWTLVTSRADGSAIDDSDGNGPKLNTTNGMIIGNYILGNNFDKVEGNNGAYAIRKAANKYYQGASLHMHTTVSGYLSIWAANEGHSMTLNLVNDGRDMQIAQLTGSQVEYKVYVKAGDVVIYNIPASSTYPMRVSKMIFTVDETPDYTRTVSNNIGTLCVDHNVVAGGALGATFYQIASRNELYDYKIDFEEVLPGEELKAGQPYIFKSNTGKIELFYGATVADAPVAVRGMIGSFANTTLDITETNKSDILYIASNKLWNCEDLVGIGLEVVANRAYIVMSDVPTYAEYLEAQQNSNNAPRRRVTLGKDEAQVVTGFGELETSETPVKVLINGQIFIIRGEKMFDVTGKLVK